jgi:hypothetical protein
MRDLMIRIRPWALFLILVCPAIAASVISEPDQYSVLEISANLISTVVYFSWLWSINRFVRSRPEASVNDKFFYVCLGIAFLCFLIFNLSAFFVDFSKANHPSIVSLAILLLAVYCMVATSRALKSFELRRQAVVREYFWDFVSLLVFPIGIWFLQPRINRLPNWR